MEREAIRMQWREYRGKGRDRSVVNRFQSRRGRKKEEQRKKKRETREKNREREGDSRGERKWKARIEGEKKRDPFAKCSSTVFGPFLGAITFPSPSYATRAREGIFFENATRRITLIRFGLQIFPFPRSLYRYAHVENEGNAGGSNERKYLKQHGRLKLHGRSFSSLDARSS